VAVRRPAPTCPDWRVAAIKQLVKVGLRAGWLAPWIAQGELESGVLGSLQWARDH
jgi:hypothetical protein